MIDHMQMRASHYSQTKSLILGDLGYDAPSRKEEKNWIYGNYGFWIKYWRWAPRKHVMWGIYEKKEESWEFELVMVIVKIID